MSLYAIAFLGTTPIGAPLVGLIVSWSNPRVGIAWVRPSRSPPGGLVFSHRRDERNVANYKRLKRPEFWGSLGRPRPARMMLRWDLGGAAPDRLGTREEEQRLELRDRVIPLALAPCPVASSRRRPYRSGPALHARTSIASSMVARWASDQNILLHAPKSAASWVLLSESGESAKAVDLHDLQPLPDRTRSSRTRRSSFLCRRLASLTMTSHSFRNDDGRRRRGAAFESRAWSSATFQPLLTRLRRCPWDSARW